ncbi:hypothetical protein L2E82_22429 [Cichorium intybus]|uniref:Uncharacterized protein n=1 Tax=Cichorium intybus TaxID=13427 RepID=A0ACB9DYP1_CICIN|nr:hypothetical protein L2E82_22429 [Cichorium intybus]
MDEAASMSVLLEGCLSDVLSLTSPRDACRAASISKGFNSVADSDAVWEQFLIPDYREIIAEAVSAPLVFGSKKQLYLCLSDYPVLLDRGYMSFQLDKESGKKCYMLGAKELSIAWQGDTRYWEWGHVPEAGILIEVWWLSIRGKIASVILSQKSTYVAYLVFRTTGDSRGLAMPATTRLSDGGIQMVTENIYLRRPRASGRTGHVPQQENDEFPRRRKDGWMEIKLGEFECNEGDDRDVEMAFDEHQSWKTGLIVEGIELRPK